MTGGPDILLTSEDPPPVSVYNEDGESPFLIVADHAGNDIPRALGCLGIPETECERHIAWDIGIAAVGRLVANALDATLVQQNYSRLVIDCNRMPGSETSIAEALIAMHSFTPVFMDVTRPWHAGVLYNRDPRFAHLLLDLLKREDGLVIGDNEPYSVTDASDYTIPVHGERRGLHHVAIEVRQDLIADDKGQREWALLLERLLPLAYQKLTAAEILSPG